jgi:hypothetical protein
MRWSCDGEEENCGKKHGGKKIAKEVQGKLG